MSSKITTSVIIALIYIASGARLSASSAPLPLGKSEVLALVAGGIFPENIAHDIKSRGIAFVPDDNLKSLLKAAGADVKIFVALKAAKISSLAEPEGAD